MLEHYFRYPRVLRRLRGGGLGDELDHIAAYLFDNGYRRASAKAYLSRLGRFSGHVSRAAREKPITQAVIELCRRAWNRSCACVRTDGDRLGSKDCT